MAPSSGCESSSKSARAKGCPDRHSKTAGRVGRSAARAEIFFVDLPLMSMKTVVSSNSKVADVYLLLKTHYNCNPISN